MKQPAKPSTRKPSSPTRRSSGKPPKGPTGRVPIAKGNSVPRTATAKTAAVPEQPDLFPAVLRRWNGNRWLWTAGPFQDQQALAVAIEKLRLGPRERFAVFHNRKKYREFHAGDFPPLPWRFA